MYENTKEVSLTRKLVGLFAAVPLVTGIVVALQPSSWLLSHILSDDAYYYFQIARNAATGHGITLDGLHLTNGFHPLWMAILTGLYRVFPDAVVIPIALIISALCGTVTVLLIGRLLVRWRVTSGWLTICLGLLVLNPWLTLQWVNGLETSVACLLLVTTWFYADYMVREGGLFIRQAVIVSFLAGFTALGRTDFAIALAPLLIYLWWKLWTRDSHRYMVAIGYAMLMAGVVLSVQAPWLAWNWHVFGTLMQSSGLAFSFVNHELLYMVHANDLITNLKGAVLGLMNAGRQMWVGLVAPLAYLIALGSVLLYRHRAKLGFKIPSSSAVIIAALGVILLLAVNVTIRWVYRPWYAVPLFIILILAIGHFSRQLPRLTLPRYLLVGMIVLTFVSFGLAVPKVIAEYSPQANMYEVAQWINKNIPADKKVGAFNSGIYAYFSGRTIVNLDGLVNNNAAKALQNRDLRDYAAAEDLSYLIDFDLSVNYRYGWAWDDSKSKISDNPVIHTFDGDQRNGAIRVFQLK